MQVLGPTYYSEWEYTGARCKTLRIALFGELHQEPVCTQHKETVPIETFFSDVLRDTGNQDRFAMDLFLEVEYTQKDMKKIIPRGKTQREAAGTMLIPSKIFDIQQCFAPELKTKQRVVRGFRAHYIDYRHGGVTVPAMLAYNAQYDIADLLEDLRDMTEESGQGVFRARISEIKRRMPRPRVVRKDLLTLLNTIRVKKQYSRGLLERLKPFLEKEVKKRTESLDTACARAWNIRVPVTTPNRYQNIENRKQTYKKFFTAMQDVEDAITYCRALVMDFYALGRILKCTRPRAEKPGLAIVYAGSEHPRFYARAFRALGLQRVSSVVDVEDTDEQCIPMESIRFLDLLMYDIHEKRRRQGGDDNVQQGVPSIKKPRI